MKSWRTTVAGIIGALAVIAPAMHNQMEGRHVDWTLVFGALSVSIGLIFARDNRVSSEQAGVK
jgi:hypothetical protein